MIVTMAIVTTLAMPPTLRWALARLPIRAEEKERLEREEMEDRGFVSKLERLLVAVDDSANGQFGTARRRHDRGHPLDADNRHAHHSQKNSRFEEVRTKGDSQKI